MEPKNKTNNLYHRFFTTADDIAAPEEVESKAPAKDETPKPTKPKTGQSTRNDIDGRYSYGIGGNPRGASYPRGTPQSE